jgi:hypothetical protein
MNGLVVEDSAMKSDAGLHSGNDEMVSMMGTRDGQA